MGQAKIQWKIKAAGRFEGEIETVEIDTPFMQGCLKQGRFVVLEHVEEEPVVTTFTISDIEPEVLGLLLQPVDLDDPEFTEEPSNADPGDEQPEQPEPVKLTRRPRTPRKRPSE